MAVLALLLILALPISNYLDKAKTSGHQELPPPTTSRAISRERGLNFCCLFSGSWCLSHS
jgi:hypothetical protein